jgi:hypothetical protein
MFAASGLFLLCAAGALFFAAGAFLSRKHSVLFLSMIAVTVLFIGVGTWAWLR